MQLNTSNPFFAGLRGLMGSGGSIAKVEVRGGQYGIYAVKTGDTPHASLPSYPPAPRPANDQLNTNGSQPVPVASTISLYNQTKYAIYYDGRGPLTLVGGILGRPNLPSDSDYRIIKATSSDFTGQGLPNGTLNIIDTTFDFRGDGVYSANVPHSR